jgi:hypothetical protein
MRAQVSLELFLVALLASGILYAYIHLIATWTADPSSVAQQTALTANSLAIVADQAGRAAANVTHTLPCLTHQAQPVPYLVTLGERTASLGVLAAGLTKTAPTGILGSGVLVVECLDGKNRQGAVVCIQGNGTHAVLASGACP